MISLGDRPGSGPRGAGPPGPNRDASHCGRNAWQKSSTSQKTSTIRSNIIASVTQRWPLTSKSLSVTTLNRAKTPYPGYDMSQLPLSGVMLSNAKLIGASFARSNLSKADLKAAILMMADLEGADLSRSRSARGPDLRGACFNGANLAEANLAGADLRTGSLGAVSTKRQPSSAMPLSRRTELIDANLSRATLVGSNLGNCDLTGAELVDADLSGADLTGAILVSTDLSGATLKNTTLAGALLCGALLDDNAIAEMARHGINPEGNLVPLGGRLFELLSLHQDWLDSEGRAWQPVLNSTLPISAVRR